MQPLRTAAAVALGAFALCATAPGSYAAPAPGEAPFVQPVHPPAHPVRPVPPHGPHRPNTPALRPGQRRDNRYPIVIDAGVVDRYLATPAAASVPKHPAMKPTPRPKNAPDVFETHSTSNE